MGGYHRHDGIRAAAVTEAISGLGSQRRVLDLGANRGALSAHLANLGHDVVAVERQHLKHVSPSADATGSVEWVHRDVEISEFRTLGQFDIVIALSVLHHFKPQTALAWSELYGMARQLVIVELPDPKETRGDARTELPDAVFSTPGARVLLWLPGWKVETWRPLVTVPAVDSRLEERSGVR